MPIAKAISVVVGTPQPRAAGLWLLIATYIAAGTAMPPSAATIGSVAFFTDESSPARISRLISSPTTKKNNAITPSLIQWRKVRTNWVPFHANPIRRLSNRKYSADHVELAQASATKAAVSNRKLPLASDSKNRTKAL